MDNEPERPMNEDYKAQIENARRCYKSIELEPDELEKLIAENEDLAAVKFAENALRQALQAKVETLEEERQSIIDTMDSALADSHELQLRVDELEAEKLGLEETLGLAAKAIDDAQGAENRAGLRCAELEAFAKAHEQWEANLINADEMWAGDNGQPFTSELYDEFIEVQSLRNASLKKAEATDGE